MSFGRIVLVIAPIAFAAFGVAFFLWPDALAEPVDIALPTAAARTESRTVYGGLQLGLGVFLASCAASPARTTIGLLATTSCLAGMIVARVLGALLDGELAGLWRVPGRAVPVDATYELQAGSRGRVRGKA